MPGPDHEITNKWPHVVLIGPRVSEARALQYIARTDHTLRWPEYAGNDHAFRERVCQLLGYRAASERQLEEMHHVSLGHLQSDWIASSYIHGPHGPVHPDGTVHMERNFGKWPNVGEIEGELSTVAREFPWLEFNLYLWDNPEEERRGDPDISWRLVMGTWWRVHRPVVLEPSLPAAPDIERAVMRIATGTKNEQAFSLEGVERLIKIARSGEFDDE